MGGFSKLFSSILESTVWLESPETKVVWITMLALSDRFGNVDASIPGLARRSGVSIEECQEALRIFLSPDPHSRSHIMDGRRLEEIDGGWRLINYEKYRGMQGDGEAPAHELDESGRSSVKVYFIQCGAAIKIGSSRNPWARLTQLKTGMPDAPKLLGYFNAPMSREKELHKQFAAHRINGEWFKDCEEIRSAVKSLCTTGSDAVATKVATKVGLPSYIQKQIPDTDAEAKKKDSAAPRLAGFDDFWKLWPKRVARAAAERAWAKIAPDAKALRRILAAVAEQSRSPDWTKDGGKFIPHPATWLNGRRWEDEASAPRGAGDGIGTFSASELAP